MNYINDNSAKFYMKASKVSIAWKFKNYDGINKLSELILCLILKSPVK